MLIHHNLDSMNACVRDFCQILKSWYDAPLLRFAPEEVHSMYDSHTAKGIGKLIKVIEGVATQLKLNGYQIEPNFQKKWWEGNAQYAINVWHPNDVDATWFWFGLWDPYWEDHGVPLCF